VVLNGLERPDGPSGLLAHFGVIDAHIEDTLRTPYHLRATCQGTSLQHRRQALPALASRPQEHVFPYRHIMQGNLIGNDNGTTAMLSGLALVCQEFLY